MPAGDPLGPFGSGSTSFNPDDTQLPPPFDASSKVVFATRALDAASGTQTITGVGFRPRAVDVIALVNGTQIRSDGCCDASLVQFAAATAVNAGTGYVVFASGNTIAALFANGAAADYQMAVLTGWTSDGCTISWTRTGTMPAGTVSLLFRFWR